MNSELISRRAAEHVAAFRSDRGSSPASRARPPPHYRCASSRTLSNATCWHRLTLTVTYDFWEPEGTGSAPCRVVSWMSCVLARY
jgi:hypothetical protein